VNTDVDLLLGKASREQLLPVYTEVKGLVCCMVPNIFATMWTGLTFAGGLWVAAVADGFWHACLLVDAAWCRTSLPPCGRVSHQQVSCWLLL
jgi:hypothetical protein